MQADKHTKFTSMIPTSPDARIGLCSLSPYKNLGVLKTAEGLCCRLGSLEADATVEPEVLIRDQNPGREGSRIRQRKRLKRSQPDSWEVLD